MSRSLDLSGAPASNAGDAFHETWALRQALQLLDPASKLTELYVEGVRESPETDPAAYWDGVDCALYYDNGQPPTSRVELVQLKYSVASPQKPWSRPRFYKSTAKKGNNSVARRLANAFKGATKRMTAAQVRETVRVRFVTNQPIAQTLAKGIAKAARGTLSGAEFDQLWQATGLAKSKVKLFCECLTLEGNEQSYDTLKADATLSVSGLLDAPPADTIDGLLMKIRLRMMPGGTRRIDEAAVMGWFGLGQKEALFPSEPRLEPLGAVISRAVTGTLAEAVVAHPLVCLHGDGGCGKTTTAQTLDAALPPGSRTILYDCYGAGAYRDQSQPRHRPLEAFMQLSNELARVTNTPLFFPYPTRPDMASAFRKKLTTAAGIFALERPDGLLVILIDAADNAVHAATTSAPTQECFVHQLATFTDLPSNVRLVFSTRTARLESLRLPEDAAKVPCPPFSLQETTDFLALHALTGPSSAIEDFHELSTHNPRVQSNAVQSASTLAEAIEFLRPNGQTLPDLFDAMIEQARSRAGVETSRALLCAGLAVLPTPIPTTYLASVWGLTEPICRDLVVELTQRNVRLGHRGVEIANEDFQAYCEERGQPETVAITSMATDKLMQDRLSSEYAATHLFDLLVKSGRKADLHACLDEAGATAAIADPMKRRQVALSRLRAALHVSALSGDALEIGKTIFIGAESVPSAGKVKQVIRENPDLSAAFVPDTVSALVLNDREARREHGPLLMHLSAEHARKGEFFDARMRRRAANEWLRTLFSRHGEALGWSYKSHDIVGMLMAVFCEHGWHIASEECGRWSPRSYALHLRAQLLKQVAIERGVGAIESLRDDIEPEHLFLILNALVRAGRHPDEIELATALASLRSTAFDFGGGDWAIDMTVGQRLTDEIMFFLEHASRIANLESDCLETLNRLSPPGPAELDNVHLSRPYPIDVALRAATLRGRLTRQPLDLASVYPTPREPEDRDPDSNSRQAYGRSLEKHEDIEKVVPLYETLAGAWADPTDEARKALTAKLATLRERARRPFEFDEVRRVIGRRMLELLALQGAGADTRLAMVSSLAHDDTLFTDDHEDWFPYLLHDSRTHAGVTASMEAKAANLRSMHAKATEKANGLIRIARMFLPFHRPNADVYFSEALAAVEEVDLEALDVLHALCRMMERSQPDTPKTRARASRFARLVHVAGGLLQSEDGFPQEEAVRTLTVACPSVAAATVSRWSDEGFHDRVPDLKTFTECGLDSGLLTPSEALLLSGLIPTSDKELESKVLQAATRTARPGSPLLAEEIARSRLLAMAPGAREHDYDDLRAVCLNSGQAPESLVKIEEIQSFRAVHADTLKRKAKADDPCTSIKNELAPPDWSAVDPFDPAALAEMQKANRDAGFFDAESFFVAMRAKTGIADRCRHLDALAEAARADKFPDAEVKAILGATEDWTDAAVRKWRREVLPKLIVDLGYKTLGYDWYDPAAIDVLLEGIEASDSEIRKVIATLIESHAFNLGSRSILKLLAHFVRRLPQEDANALIDVFIDRTEARLKLQDVDLARYAMDTSSLPKSGAEITAALIYRCLGDIDGRLNWRATHALRRAVRIGADNLLTEILSAALLEVQPPYTFGDCPFYAMTADLQLAIGLARLSFEAPVQISGHEPSLMALWRKRAPHLLIGHFLSRALKTAKALGESIMTSAADIASMTSEAAPRARRVEGSRPEKLDRYRNVGKRFSFDSTDSIPYWYNPTLEIFADLTPEELIATAERWIVDKWGGHETTSHWENEPRRRRMRGEYGLYSHRHGSLPAICRYWTYLEWHGLFTAVGELIQSNPLREPEDDDTRDTYESWLSRYDTVYAGAWASDVRSAPPLDLRYWRVPHPEAAGWLDEARTSDLGTECFTESGAVILYGHRESRTYASGDEVACETVRSIAALVPTVTAAALLRAFAATPDPSDIYFPEPGHFGREQPEDPRFVPIPTITYPLQYRHSGLDEMDPARFGVRGVRIAPSPELRSAAGLIEGEPWSQASRKEGLPDPAVFYTAWSSLPNGDHDPRQRYSDETYTDGDRLEIAPVVLRKAMTALGCNLAVIVHITRSSGDEYAKVSKRGRKEEGRAEVFLIRRDGRIETANGDYGTWTEADQSA